MAVQIQESPSKNHGAEADSQHLLTAEQIESIQKVLVKMHHGREIAEEDLSPLEKGHRAHYILSEAIGEYKEDGKDAAFAVIHRGKNESPAVFQALEKIQSSRKIKFKTDTEVENLPKLPFLLAGILPQKCVAVLYGFSGTYKSFLALAWALSVACGVPWQGREVTRGGVAYIAAEGYEGQGPRLKAWKAYHHLPGESGVRFYDRGVALPDPSVLDDLMLALDLDFPDSPKLIIIDTLIKNSGGADENSNTEMSKLVLSCDLLKERYGCTVLLIHHSGKDRAKGIRGASCLRDGVDVTIGIDRNEEGDITVKNEKQKGEEECKPFRLIPQKVQYGEAEDDTSLVLVPSDIEIDDTEEKISAKRSVQTMYDLLIGKELINSEWVKLGNEHGMSDSTAKRAIKELYEHGKVWYKKEGKLYYIPSKGSSALESQENAEEGYLYA